MAVASGDTSMTPGSCTIPLFPLSLGPVIWVQRFSMLSLTLHISRSVCLGVPERQKKCVCVDVRDRGAMSLTYHSCFDVTWCKMSRSCLWPIRGTVRSFSCRILATGSHDAESRAIHKDEECRFWDVAPCSSCVQIRFRGTYRLHLQGRRWRRYIHPKRRFTQDVRGATSQKRHSF
jgi:hypothetical protein